MATKKTASKPAAKRCTNGKPHRWKTVVAGTDYFRAICLRCHRLADFVLKDGE